MVGRARWLWWCAVLMAGAVDAQEVAPPAEATPTESNPRLMKSGNLDLRVTGDTDVLLVYLEVGAGADFGLLPLGPGTLSVGGEFDVGFCGSLCFALGALTGLQWSQNFYHPYARVGYHFPLKGAKSLEKVDLYGLAMAGLVVTSFGMRSPDGSIRVTGTDTGLAVAAGAGANYFINERLFVGAEGRLRYAAGRYKWKVEVGQYSVSDEQASWNLSGLNFMLFIGARL